MEVSFILVEPAVPENVGAAARAIKTMGFGDLRLVNPCDHLEMKARMLAHASNDILESAKVYQSLEEAIKDVDFVFATSAKQRWVKLDIIPCNELTDFIEKKGDTINSIAIVFGREESGLTNEEIALCHRVSNIPLKTQYPSLNLAQSVMIYAYTLSFLNIESPEKQIKNQNPDSLKALIVKVQTILSAIELGPDKLINGRLIERITELDAEDVKLLHSLTAALSEKIKPN
ncbi:MAG TPA: tRNA/rRNA methyltransferase [Tenuifilaceae bacterium]|nr:tRNA/rRNA methyltransferase [Tenuifilaceae bacterium]HPI44060.1 tRNA/rRNA methyltransferase [Tenuifilaceae bacterium]HPN21719.1 tRNA/rRNA methyltransferase [Tenuifilaceae bacterium]